MLPRPCRDDFEDKGRQIFVSIIWLKIKYTRSPSTAYNITSLLFSPITAYVICLMSCSSESCYFLTAYAFMLLLTWIQFLRAIKWLLRSLWSWFHLIIRLTVSLDTWQTCMCVVPCSMCPDSVSFLGPSIAAYGPCPSLVPKGLFSGIWEKIWHLNRVQIQPLNFTIQKEDSHHIKMAAHVWSTKCRWN
jgi:hypothetical protein